MTYRAALFGLACCALGVATASRADEPSPKVGPNSADEPLAPALSMEKAARFLDDVAVDWTRKRQCGTCHTNYNYMMARPALKEVASTGPNEVRAFFEGRVAHWDDDDKKAKPLWDAEVVATAAALALNDAGTTGTLAPLTRKALDRVWAVQRPDGGFDWLKCDWPPLEHDDFYGATIAAVGVGFAPDDYRETEAARKGLEKLRAYFRKNSPPSLHHKAMLLWASARVDGLMDGDERAKTVERLRAIQRPDGGWNLPSLGDWKRHDGSGNDPDGPGDGFGTGFVVYVLRQAGVPADDPAVRRGVEWLKTHQRASGRWFTRSVSTDSADHYITHAGTGFAILALKACGVKDGGTDGAAAVSSR